MYFLTFFNNDLKDNLKENQIFPLDLEMCLFSQAVREKGIKQIPGRMYRVQLSCSVSSLYDFNLCLLGKMLGLEILATFL